MLDAPQSMSPRATLIFQETHRGWLWEDIAPRRVPHFLREAGKPLHLGHETAAAYLPISNAKGILKREGKDSSLVIRPKHD